MLPDLSSSHILILVVAALIVVGPKDLPKMLRKIGQVVGKMRGMANEFRASFDEMARQSELDDLRKEVEAMRAATQASIPQTLGIEEAIKGEAEGSYMAQWEASHAQPDAEPFQPGPPMMPPTTVEAVKPAKAAKAKPSAAKPKAAASKSKTTDDAPKAAKPRAKKAKPNPEAEA